MRQILNSEEVMEAIGMFLLEKNGCKKPGCEDCGECGTIDVEHVTIMNGSQPVATLEGSDITFVVSTDES